MEAAACPCERFLASAPPPPFPSPPNLDARLSPFPASTFPGGRGVIGLLALVRLGEACLSTVFPPGSGGIWLPPFSRRGAPLYYPVSPRRPWVAVPVRGGWWLSLAPDLPFPLAYVLVHPLCFSSLPSQGVLLCAPPPLTAVTLPLHRYARSLGIRRRENLQ